MGIPCFSWSLVPTSWTHSCMIICIECALQHTTFIRHTFWGPSFWRPQSMPCATFGPIRNSECLVPVSDSCPEFGGKLATLPTVLAPTIVFWYAYLNSFMHTFSDVRIFFETYPQNWKLRNHEQWHLWFSNFLTKFEHKNCGSSWGGGEAIRNDGVTTRVDILIAGTSSWTYGYLNGSCDEVD